MRTENGLEYELSDPISSDKYQITDLELASYPSTIVSLSLWLEKSEQGWFIASPRMATVVDLSRQETFRSFCKHWAIWDQDAQVWHPTRIGLGAYGDTTVWHRDVIAKKRFAV